MVMMIGVTVVSYLSRGSSGDERGRGMLDLHLVEQHIAVFGDLDIARARHQHLHGPTWTQIGLEYILDALGRADIHGQRLSRASHFSLGIQQRDRRHDDDDEPQATIKQWN